MMALHKDFHGVLSHIIQHVADNYGPEELRGGLRRIGRVCYAPLSERLRRDGLVALEEHWRHVFELEDGQFSLSYEDGGQVLVLQVHCCPALAYLREKGQPVADRFCEHTRYVNEGLCHAAGYECSTEADQARGRCTQRFWHSGQGTEAPDGNREDQTR